MKLKRFSIDKKFKTKYNIKPYHRLRKGGEYTYVEEVHDESGKLLQCDTYDAWITYDDYNDDAMKLKYEDEGLDGGDAITEMTITSSDYPRRYNRRGKFWIKYIKD